MTVFLILIFFNIKMLPWYTQIAVLIIKIYSEGFVILKINSHIGNSGSIEKFEILSRYSWQKWLKTEKKCQLFRFENSGHPKKDDFYCCYTFLNNSDLFNVNIILTVMF
jgi:hypothetical protein